MGEAVILSAVKTIGDPSGVVIPEPLLAEFGNDRDAHLAG